MTVVHYQPISPYYQAFLDLVSAEQHERKREELEREASRERKRQRAIVGAGLGLGALGGLAAGGLTIGAAGMTGAAGMGAGAAVAPSLSLGPILTGAAMGGTIGQSVATGDYGPAMAALANVAAPRELSRADVAMLGEFGMTLAEVDRARGTMSRPDFLAQLQKQNEAAALEQHRKQLETELAVEMEGKGFKYDFSPQALRRLSEIGGEHEAVMNSYSQGELTLDELGQALAQVEQHRRSVTKTWVPREDPPTPEQLWKQNTYLNPNDNQTYSYTPRGGWKKISDDDAPSLKDRMAARKQALEELRAGHDLDAGWKPDPLALEQRVMEILRSGQPIQMPPEEIFRGAPATASPFMADMWGEALAGPMQIPGDPRELAAAAQAAAQPGPIAGPEAEQMARSQDAEQYLDVLMSSEPDMNKWTEVQLAQAKEAATVLAMPLIEKSRVAPLADEEKAILRKLRAIIAK